MQGKLRDFWASRLLALGLVALAGAGVIPPLFAQEAGAEDPAAAVIAAEVQAASEAPDTQAPDAQAPDTQGSTGDTPAAAKKPNTPNCRADVGCVTNLPLPRFVSLKGGEGNARRGPGLTHRIDWVFTRPGMPLMLTAEYENWRRVEDQDGAGGWVHYALLSGVRSVVITEDMVEFRDAPSPDARVVAQAELGVVARIMECAYDWCRLSVGGERGWVRSTSIWGVKPDEKIE